MEFTVTLLRFSKYSEGPGARTFCKSVLSGLVQLTEQVILVFVWRLPQCQSVFVPKIKMSQGVGIQRSSLFLPDTILVGAGSHPEWKIRDYMDVPGILFGSQ